MRRKAGARLDKQARALRAERRRLIGWRYIPAVVIYCAFCSLVIVYLARVSNPEVVWMFVGFAGGVSLLFLHVATDTVSVSRIESAAVGEWSTSSEVRKLSRKGWKIIDNMPMDGFDIDHIAIGPGGVIALETKWTSDGLTDEQGHLNFYGHRAVNQIERNVPRIDALLKQNGSEARVAHACVVSWGMCQIPERLTSRRRQITVIDGPQLREFLADREPILSSAEADRAFSHAGCSVDGEVCEVDHVAEWVSENGLTDAANGGHVAAGTTASSIKPSSGRPSTHRAASSTTGPTAPRSPRSVDGSTEATPAAVMPTRTTTMRLPELRSGSAQPTPARLTMLMSVSTTRSSARETPRSTVTTTLRSGW
ncbi:MAG: nuclease-related domain-containing protein [Actinomycetota bacterium]